MKIEETNIWQRKRRKNVVVSKKRFGKKKRVEKSGVSS